MTEDGLTPSPSQSTFVLVPPLTELGSSPPGGLPRAQLILLSQTPHALSLLMTMWLPLGLSPVTECRQRGGAPCPHDASMFTLRAGFQTAGGMLGTTASYRQQYKLFVLAGTQ